MNNGIVLLSSSEVVIPLEVAIPLKAAIMSDAAALPLLIWRKGCSCPSLTSSSKIANTTAAANGAGGGVGGLWYVRVPDRFEAQKEVLHLT